MPTLNQEEILLLERADSWLEIHREEFIADLIQWVRVPSISDARDEKPGEPFGAACAKMLDLALSRARDLGFSAVNHDGYAGSVFYGDSGEPAIGLVGHLDVVPEGGNWLYPPYGPTIIGDCMIGRGVADNKGASVVALYLLRIFRDLQIPLVHRLQAIFGCAEETGMQDLIWFAEHERVPEVSLVLDGMFPVCNGQKGGLNIRLYIPTGETVSNFQAGIAENNVPDFASVLLKGLSLAEVQNAFSSLPEEAVKDAVYAADPLGVLVTAKGHSGHAAFPEGTRNAILVLATVLLKSGILAGKDKNAIECISLLLADYYGISAGIGFEDTASGKLTLNGGIIRPCQDGLELSVDIRYPVTVTQETVLEALKKQITPFDVTFLGVRNANPYYLEKDDPRVQVLVNSYNDLRDEHAAPYVMGGGTYSRALPRAITFGPGFPKTGNKTADFLPEGHGNAHGPDEVVRISSLFEALRIYLISIVRLDAQ